MKKLHKALIELLKIIKENYTYYDFSQLHSLQNLIIPINFEVAEIKRCLCSVYFALDYKFLFDCAINSLKK